MTSQKEWKQIFCFNSGFTLLTKDWIWQNWRLLTLPGHYYLVKMCFPELIWQWFSLGNFQGQMNSWIPPFLGSNCVSLPQNPCVVSVSSFFALWKGKETMLSTWWQNHSERPCSHTTLGIFRNSLTLVSITDYLVIWFTSDFVICRMNYSCLIRTSLFSLMPHVSPFSHGSPNGKALIHSDVPCWHKS